MSNTFLTKTDFWNHFVKARSIMKAVAALTQCDPTTREGISHQVEGRLNDLERECRRIKDLNLLSKCSLRAGIDRGEWEYDVWDAIDQMRRLAREAWDLAAALIPADLRDNSAAYRSTCRAIEAKQDYLNQAGSRMFPLLDLIEPESGSSAETPPAEKSLESAQIGPQLPLATNTNTVTSPLIFVGPDGRQCVDISKVYEAGREAERKSGSDYLRIDGNKVYAMGEHVPLNMTAEKAAEAVLFLSELIKEPVNWLSSGDINTRMNRPRQGKRFDLIFKALPEAIRDLIDSQTGRGFCLRK